MSIERDRRKDLEKGQVLIVAEGVFNNKTDGIIVYDSYTICSAIPKILQQKGTLTSEKIYITGHGKTNQKISGRTMEEIADMLVDNYGYTGVQDIEILSCHAKNDDVEKDMADSLRKSLREKLKADTLKKSAELLEKVEKKLSTLDSKDKAEEDKTGRDDKEKTEIQQLNKGIEDCKLLLAQLSQNTICKVEAFAYYTTVVYGTDIKDIVFTSEFGGTGFTFLQRKKCRQMKCGKMNIEEMHSFYHLKGEDVGKYNYWLMYGEGVEEEMKKSFNMFFANVAVVVILIIVGMYLIFAISTTLASVVGCVLMLVAIILMIVLYFSYYKEV